MNKREEWTISNPWGEEQSVSKFTIDDATNPFVLRNVTSIGRKYTLSFWIQSEAEGLLVVAGTEIPTSTEWKRQVVLFDATTTNLVMSFAAGTYYIYRCKLEIGNKDTDWSPNPEDIESDLAETNLDLNRAKTLIQQNKEAITLLATSEEFGELEKRVKTAEQKLTADGIKSIVGTYYATASSVTEIQTTFEQTAKDLTVKITDAAKTATNFLKYDGGLIVGEIPQAESETLGNNVLITTKDVQIRNGEVVLAKYSGNQIDLGCSGNISAIKLLNGIGEIKAVYNEDYETKDIEIVGKTCATLSSPEVASLMADKGKYTAYVRCYTNVDTPLISIYAGNTQAHGAIKVGIDSIQIETAGLFGVSSENVQINEDKMEFIGHFTAIDSLTTGGNLYCDGRIKSEGIYTATGTSAANVVISDNHWMYRSTSSSKRYKHDIQSLGEELNSEKLLDIPVRQYIYNLDYLEEEDQRYNTVVPGFIAEEVYEHYPIAAEMADGQVEDWNHRMIIPPMLDLVQKLWKRVDELEKKS